MDWKTQLFVFLSNPVVSSALFLGLLMGAYMEFSTPGFGLPGSIALICLFLIILSSFALEIASWLELFLLLAGVGIVALDLFVLPTFGLIGIFGVILFLAGLFGLMLPGAGSMDFELDTGTFNAAGEAVMNRLAWLSGTLVVGIGLMILLARYVTPSFSGFNRFVLKGHEQEGYQAFSSELLPQPGKTGKAETTLRPAGKVIIDGKYYDAISSGSFIEKGSPIHVIGFDSGTLLVEEESKT
ncbi:NfeD family protein [Parachlamydia acanthamoebae]|nr:NfeD family protein [Parachlamydia acanthamoebae]